MTNPADDLVAELAHRNRRAMDAMATDPPTSRAQQQAMCAAASGKSRLGIPKSVGEENCGPISKDFSEMELPQRRIPATSPKEELYAPAGKDDYPGYMPYRQVTEQDVADKEAMLANAVKGSPDYNRLMDEIERLRAQIKAQGGGRMGGRANDHRPKR